MCRSSECVDCGAGVPASGKRGPLPKRCDACKKACELNRSRAKHKEVAAKGIAKVCVYCKKEWRARHPKSRFCSRNCQYLSSGGRVLLSCEHCKKTFKTTLKRKLEGHRFCGRMCMRQALGCQVRCCVECGKEFRRNPKGPNGKNDKALFCSKPCYFAARSAGRVAWDTTNQRKAVWHRFGPYASAPSARLMRRISKAHAAIEWAGNALCRLAAKELARPTCENCGCPCNDGASRFCSYACNKAWRGPRSCKCGTVVENVSAHSRPSCKACKAESRRQHRRMYGSYKRRCRTYGGHFNADVKPKKVFVRDGWRCHLCGKKTHKVFCVDDQQSATVDHHPIPLSKGGDHDWHNVKCACFGCNTRKGSKWDKQTRMRLHY